MKNLKIIILNVFIKLNVKNYFVFLYFNILLGFLSDLNDMGFELFIIINCVLIIMRKYLQFLDYECSDNILENKLSDLNDKS